MSRPQIVLYNPRAVFHTMPLSLLAVGSSLDPCRFDVHIVDGRTEVDSLDRLRKVAGDALCLGVTVLSGAPILDALRVSRFVRAQNPSLPIVWGGWHPSLFPLEVLAELAVDISVQGQGEATFAKLVDHLASVLSGKFAGLIRDGFSSSVRRATQECRESFEVAQQSCRRKDARSSGVNFPDSALEAKMSRKCMG